MQRNFQVEVMIFKHLDIFAFGIVFVLKKLLHNFGQNLKIPIVMADNFYNVYMGKIWLVRDVWPGTARESQNKHAC